MGKVPVESRASPSGLRSSAKGEADLALVQRTLDGSAEAELLLAERLKCLPRILRFLVLRGGYRLGAGDFEDLVQDTALALWGKLDRFDGRSALETWAYRFCSLQILVKLRAIRRQPSLLGDSDQNDDVELADRAPAPADPTVDVESALALLEANEEQITRLKHYEGVTFEVIGKRLGVSSNTVKTRYYRALLKLREHLRGRHPDLFGEDPS